MKMLKTITASIFIALFLIGNGNTYANLNTQTFLESSPSNTIFEVIVDGVKYSVPIPLASSSVPVTVKIIQDDVLIFQDTFQHTTVILGDNVNQRVVGDGIDHGVVGDGIDHARLQISQSGIVLLDKEI